MLAVWIAAPVVALLVLGIVAYGVVGAAARLGREAAALDREVQPLLARVQATQGAAARIRPGERSANSR